MVSLEKPRSQPIAPYRTTIYSVHLVFYVFVPLRKSASAGSSKATQAHPCLRTKALIRFGGSALQRETASVHHWICGIADHAPATRHRPGARATARQRRGSCRWPEIGRAHV